MQRMTTAVGVTQWAMAFCCLAQVALASATDEAYIWQRRWTPELEQTVAAFADVMRGYRVLVVDGGAGGLVPVAVQWQALARAGRPVTVVVRVPGSRPDVDVRGLATLLRANLQAARTAGVRVSGVEIDHDCARSQLVTYGSWLRALQAQFNDGDNVGVWSVTALPDWLHSAELPRLLASVDGSVLQVHAVQQPGRGLFDASVAARWTAAYARNAPHPFRVALPAYATRVTTDAQGRVRAIDSDADTMPTFSPDARELVVDPRALASFLTRLRAQPPVNFVGIAWFRLPLASDRRALRATTLRALVAGVDIAATVNVERVRIANGSNFDVLLRNPHHVDVVAPAKVPLAAGCTLGDAVGGYVAAADGGGFVTATPPLLRPTTARTIGWISCAESLP